MASISGNGSRGHHKFTLEVIESSYSIDNNTSDAPFSFKLAPITKGYNWSGWGSQISYKIIINGTEYTGTIPSYDGKSTVTLKSGSQTIQHNNDGTKSIDFSFSVTDSTGQSYTSGSASVSGSLTLTTIPRASEITCSSGNIEDVLAVKITSNSNSFTHTVTYTIGNYSGTLATKTSQTSLNFNTASIKDNIYSQIPNGTSISGTIRCTTYSGNNQIGDVKTSSFILSTSRERCCPVLSNVSCIDTNTNLHQFTGSNQKFIRYKSLPQVNFTATARNSSSIASYYISMSGGQAFTNKPCTFSNMVSNVITITAIDTRGFSTLQTLQLDMIPYVIMSISGDIKRDEELSPEGFLTGSIGVYNGSLGLVNNTLNISYNYRKAEDSTWTTGGTISNYTSSGNKVVLNKVSLGDNYDPNYEYIVRIYVQDRLETKYGDIVFQKGKSIIETGEDFININGDIYHNDVLLSNIYLSKTGGTVSGNLNVTGNLQKNGSSVALTSQIPTNNNQLINGSGFVTFETIWQNNSMSAFASQTVTLDKSINNYNYYETIYKINDEQDFYVSSGKTPVGLYNSTVSQDGFKFVYRYITAMQGTSVSFGDCRQVNSYGSGTTVKNDSLIPYRIIGYK